MVVVVGGFWELSSNMLEGILWPNITGGGGIKLYKTLMKGYTIILAASCTSVYFLDLGITAFPMFVLLWLGASDISFWHIPL